MKVAHGWIECQFQWFGWWQGVFPVEEPLNDRTRVFFAKLFDVDNRTGLKPVAARRGWPPDISDQVRMQTTNPDAPIFGESYATFDEVAAVAGGRASAPIAKIVQSMRMLVDAHGAKNVRLIIWFSDEKDKAR